jgi:hypothetical protein
MFLCSFSINILFLYYFPEVVQNAEHAYYNDTMQLDLSQPDFCEKEIWELLEECWNRDEKSRPTFAEISLFLKRKSLSYDNEQ